MDSTAALASWGNSLPKVRPVSRPTAPRSHQGAPRPPNPGTRCTPLLEAVAANSASAPGVLPTSRASQLNVAPLERMLPSTARSGPLPVSQAMVGHSPPAAVGGGHKPRTEDPV